MFSRYAAMFLQIVLKSIAVFDLNFVCNRPAKFINDNKSQRKRNIM